MTLPTLVIGIGNDFRGDDAAGLIAARTLREKHLSNVAIIEQNGDGANLMEVWEGAETVILIDAVSSGGQAGTIHRIDANRDVILAGLFGISSHLLGVGEAVELARALGELPPRLIIYGIEGANYRIGEELSPAVASQLPTLVQQIVQEISNVANDRLSS